MSKSNGKILKESLSGVLSLVLIVIMALCLTGCDDKADGTVTLPKGFDAGQDPMEILGKKVPGRYDSPTETALINAMGLKTLVYIVNIFGMLSAATILVSSFVMLLVVNYPKTVAQTKQKIVHVLFTVIFMAALPLFLDCVLSILAGSLPK